MQAMGSHPEGVMASDTVSVPRPTTPEAHRTTNVTTGNKSKRYSLVIPEDLYREVERLANEEQTTVVDLLRRFIKLGLLITRVQQDPTGAVIIREGSRERELIIL